MFKPGDWVYVIDIFKDKKFVTHGMVVGKVGDYFFACEQGLRKPTIEEIYKQYRSGNDLEIMMIRDVLVFATKEEAEDVLNAERTEQGAREVLEVMG